MKKLVIVALALIVSCIFTVTPARAGATTVVEATAEALGAMMELLPSEDKHLAEIAFDLGVASAEITSGSGDEETCKRAFHQAMGQMGITQAQQEMAEKFFELGLVVGLAELEEAADEAEEESDGYEPQENSVEAATKGEMYGPCEARSCLAVKSS